MDIAKILEMSQGGKALMEKGQALGLDQNQLGGLVSSLLPALARGMQTQANNQNETIGGLLNSLGGERAVAMVEAPNAAALEQQNDLGADILGKLLGGEEAKEALSQRVAERTEAAPDQISQLMPLITGLFAGSLEKANKGDLDLSALMGGGSGGGMMGGLMSMATGFLAKQSQDGKGGMADMVISMLDKDGDGSIIDDLLGQ